MDPRIDEVQCSTLPFVQNMLTEMTSSDANLDSLADKAKVIQVGGYVSATLQLTMALCQHLGAGGTKSSRQGYLKA